MDCGDFVVVVNASGLQLTGRKEEQKFHLRYSGYPGGLKATPYRDLLREKPERLVRLAVWGMLPKNRLGRGMLKKLKVYAGPDHPHTAQKPEPIDLTVKGQR